MIIVLSSMALPTSKKGCAGKYYISGKAYSAKNSITNEVLEVELGDKKWEVTTDNEGKFEIVIPWISACPSGLSAAELKIENERLNPTLVYISFEKKKISLNNEWKKYGKCFSDSKEEITWKKDLSFN
jgi:hypothetical protein